MGELALIPRVRALSGGEGHRHAVRVECRRAGEYVVARTGGRRTSARVDCGRCPLPLNSAVPSGGWKVGPFDRLHTGNPGGLSGKPELDAGWNSIWSWRLRPRFRLCLDHSLLACNLHSEGGCRAFPAVGSPDLSQILIELSWWSMDSPTER
nr:hypothetical protein CFP56_44313 [Quercus suber]